MSVDFLHNDTIYLRAVELSDVDTLYRWENDTSQWATANTHAPYSRTQLWNYANDYDGDIYAHRSLRLMVCLQENNMAIGTIDIYDFDPANNHATIGVYISSHHRGNKYGVQALMLATDYARRSIGIEQMMAITAADNTAAHVMLQAAGYRHCGTLHRRLRQGNTYGDAYIYETTNRYTTTVTSNS